MAVITSLFVASSQACLRTEEEPKARSVASSSMGTDSVCGGGWHCLGTPTALWLPSHVPGDHLGRLLQGTQMLPSWPNYAQLLWGP